MTTFEIIANVLGAIGMILIFVTSVFKNKKLVLTVQGAGHIFLGVSDCFVRSWSSAVQEGLCLIRDIGIITKKANKAFKIVVIALIAGVGYGINIYLSICKPEDTSVFSYIAVTGNLLFTIDVFYNNKSIIGLKIISALNNILWMMLFFQLHIYTSAVANGLASIINVIVAIWIAVMIKNGKFDRMGNKIIQEEKKEEKTIKIDPIK